MTLHWVERGGPTIAEVPAQAGFGSKLEKAALNGLGATMSANRSAQRLGRPSSTIRLCPPLCSWTHSAAIDGRRIA